MQLEKRAKEAKATRNVSLHKFEKAQVGPNVCISLISLSLLTQACVASPLAKKKKKK